MCIARRRRRRRCRVVDRCVTPEWPRRTAHLHRSAGERRLLAERIRSSDVLYGRPGGRFQVWLGSRPKEMSNWRRRAWWAGVSSPSLVTWPKRLMRLLMTRSVSGGRRVRLVIFSVTDTVVLPDSKSMSLAFFWKDSKLIVSLALVHMTHTGWVKK